MNKKVQMQVSAKSSEERKHEEDDDADSFQSAEDIADILDNEVGVAKDPDEPLTGDPDKDFD